MWKEHLLTFGKVLLWILIVGVVGYNLLSNDSNSSSPSSYSGGSSRYYDDSDSYDDSISMYDLAYDNWDSVSEYIEGTETIEACTDSGCYSLDADISSGSIDTLYFPNGGYIYPDAEIDSDGHAEGYDYEGNYWEFTIDSSLIEEAIQNWYDDQGADYRDESDREDYRRR